MEPDSGILLNSVRDVLYVLFRHKWKIAAVFVLTFMAVAAITFVLPPVYESEAVLLIRIGRENLPGDASMKGAMVNITQDRSSEVKSELAILSSRYLAEQVVNAVGEGWILGDAALRMEPLDLEKPGAPSLPGVVIGQVIDVLKGALVLAGMKEVRPPHEEAIEAFQENLSVDVEKQSNIVTVTYESDNAPLAQVILDKLVEFYKVRHIEVFATKASPEFFEAQAEVLRQDLASWEHELDAFRQQHGIADIQAQKETSLARISALEEDLSAAMAEAQGLQAKVGVLAEKLAAREKTREISRTTGRPNLAADAIKEKLLELRVQETDLAARYAEDYRPLVETREQIARLEEALAREGSTLTEVTVGLDENTAGLEQNYESESANLAAGLARAETLRTEIARHKQSLRELSGQEMELARLTRNQELAEKEYRDYRENLQQAKITTALEKDQVTNVSVVQPASMPLKPVRPQKTRNIILGALLGVFGGLLMAYVVEFFDDSLNTTEAVRRRLGVPVLAAVSKRELDQCI